MVFNSLYVSAPLEILLNDTDKFIISYTELGKSYIDNMIEAMNTPTKK